MITGTLWPATHIAHSTNLNQNKKNCNNDHHQHPLHIRPSSHIHQILTVTPMNRMTISPSSHTKGHPKLYHLTLQNVTRQRINQTNKSSTQLAKVTPVERLALNSIHSLTCLHYLHYPPHQTQNEMNATNYLRENKKQTLIDWHLDLTNLK